MPDGGFFATQCKIRILFRCGRFQLVIYLMELRNHHPVMTAKIYQEHNAA